MTAVRIDSDRGEDRFHGDVVCDSCEEERSNLSFCNVCNCTFCNTCWDETTAHRRNRSGPGGLRHERTDIKLARIDALLSSTVDDQEVERLHFEDEQSVWFGIHNDEHDNKGVMLRDYGRYADLLLGTTSKVSGPTRDLQQTEVVKQRHPGLVSFVGQTGAGKSTLIKLLIHLKTDPGSNQTPVTPIAGIPGENLPTSADIHMYLDPSSFDSSRPVLYADCEGLDGGERQPVAASLRHSRDSSSESGGSEVPDVSEYYLEREITWATSNNKRTKTREFAVSQLYPRLLFTFSDVIVAVDTVLDRLIEWAAAVETSSNQPILPYAILVLNACEHNIHESLWDIDNATETLLRSLANIVDKNPCLSHYSNLWRARGRKIKSVTDLIRCYYSDLRVIWMPTAGRPKLIYDQGMKLYSEISKGISMVHANKTKLRMLLNIFDFHTYFQHALNHFCQHIDIPFDFCKASFSNGQLSSTFSQNLLAMASSMINLPNKPKPLRIFENLSFLIASCILIHATRRNLLGSADRIFPMYVGQIDEVLLEFSTKFWPCEYVNRLAIQPNGDGWDNSYLFQLRKETYITRHCRNVMIAHGTRGHQFEDGSFYAGDYVSSFSIEKHRLHIVNGIYFRLHHLLEQLASYTSLGVTSDAASILIHQDDVLKGFFGLNERHLYTGFQHTDFCMSCIIGSAYHILHCGHSLCKDCIKAYGKYKTKTIIDLSECPLHADRAARRRPELIYIRPDDCGVRALCLDDGGVRSIIQVEVLRMMMNELKVNIPLHCFFDLIVGEGTGGVLALGIGSKNWSVDICDRSLMNLLQRSFGVASHRMLPGISFRQRQYGSWKYHSRPMEEFLKELFPPADQLIDRPSSEGPDYGTQVAVRAHSAKEGPVIFSSYSSRGNYQDLKLWQTARATMSNKALFKAFTHHRLGYVSFSKSKISGNPIATAMSYIEEAFFAGSLPHIDTILSLGTGTEQQASSLDEQTLQELTNNGIDELPPSGYVRLNIHMSQMPKIDDLKSINSLRQHLRRQIRPEDLQDIIARLFANLFYIETSDNTVERGENGIVVHTQILCRLPDFTDEISEIGKMFKSGEFRQSLFVFQEEGYGKQIFKMPSNIINIEMISNSRFHMPTLLVYLTQKRAIVNAAIQLATGQEYSLSGFPRRLVAEKEHHRAALSASQIADPSSNLFSPWLPPHIEDIPSIEELALGSNRPSTSASSHHLGSPHSPRSPTSQKSSRTDGLTRGIRNANLAATSFLGTGAPWDIRSTDGISVSSRVTDPDEISVVR